MSSKLKLRLNLVKLILDLCMRINVETDYYAFYRLSPHVRDITINITTKNNYKEELFYKSIYYDVNFTSHREMKKGLSEAVTTLKRFLGDAA